MTRRRDSVGRLVVIGTRCGGIALNFVLQVVLARTLSLRNFGVTMTALTLLNIAVVPAMFGYDSVAIRFVALVGGDREALRSLRRRLLPNLLAAAIAVSLVMGVAAIVVAARGNETLADALWMVMLVTPSFAVMRVGEGWLRGAGSIFWAQIGSALLVPGATSLLVLIFWAAGSGERLSPITALGARLAAGVIGLVVVTGFVARHVARGARDVTAPQAVIPSAAAMRRIGAFVCAGAAMTIFLMQVDVVAVAYLSGSVSAGLYSAASRIALALNVAVVGANFVLSPRVSRLYSEGDREGLETQIRSAATWLAILMTAGCALVFLAAPLVLRVFGPAFSQASTALRVLLVGQFVNGLTGPAGAVLVMVGRERSALKALTAAALVDAVALVTLVPWLGLTGAALASTGAAIVVNVVMVVQVRSVLGVWALPALRRPPVLSS